MPLPAHGKKKQETLISQQRHTDIVQRLKTSGFSDPAMLNWTFENDNGRSPQMHHAHRYVEQWQTMRSENLGLLLWGSVGTGKSFLAGCIANALMEQEVPVRMTNFARILNELNSSFSGRNDVVDKLCRYPLLIIDDFGMERGNSYSVRYTYEDEHGKSCDKWESFPTKEEATNRKKQIEHELAAGTFLIPSSVTVAEFLMDWLPKQCSKHKWAPKTYESNLSTIQNLIIPYIGSMEMQKLKPYHMENLYTTLSKTPCGSYIEGKKQELTEKQKQRFLSGTTIHEVHRLLGTAFQYAVEWGILVKSPVPVDSPKKSTQERTIWTVEEMRAALDSMEDPILHLAVHLTLVGALREGEIVGLTPEDLDFDAADGIGTFRINKSMQRVRKEALNQVDDGCIIKVFPDKLERSTTSLILKSTKTASSCRTIFMTSALKEELKKWLNQLAADERKDPARYHDSGMLFRLPNGLAVEPVLIRKKFLKWQDAHPEFPRIVFHGLRHSSATYQLMISGGDVKAVQGTTGHATADMLVNTYAHIQQSSRVELGRKFEDGFYAKQESPSPQAVPAAGEPTISMTALLELLKNADPEVKAQLRLALLT